MTKDREPRSINFDRDNIAWMDDNISNRSDFVNDLVRNYRNGSSEINEAVAKFRAEQLQSELEMLEERKERVERELQSVYDRQQQEQQRYNDDLDRLISVLERGGRLWPDHKEVQEIAHKHSQSLETVLADVKERTDTENITHNGEIDEH